MSTGRELLFTDEERSALTGVVVNRPRGSLLFAEGERTTEAILILEGHVKVTLGGPNRIIAICGPGEVIGEMTSVTGQPRSASAYALDDISILVVSGKDWIKFLHERPRVCFALLRLMESRLRASTATLSMVSWVSVEPRLASALLELGRTLGMKDPRGIAIHGVSQRELAGIIGASRESVAQVMSRFRGHRLVATGRQRITILDAARLREIAEMG